MKKYILLTLFVVGIMVSCKKNEAITSEENISIKKFTDPVIDIHVDHSSFETRSLKDILAGKKLSGNDVIKDSLWANEFGRTLLVETDEIALMKNTAYERYIYAGSLLQGNTIADLNFAPISEFQSSVKPITVSVSFQAKRVSGTIANPSLSATRNFISSIMAQPGIGTQVAAFSYSLERFTSYDEMKLAFGSNIKTGTLFGNKSSGSSESIDKIALNTGMYVKFVQKNFTLDLDIPSDGKLMNDNVDMGKLNSKFPTYVSSITYGRMGIMSIESNYSYEEVNTAYNTAFKALFVSGSKSVSEHEKKIIDESSMKIYIIGSDGTGAVESINGFDSFVQFIIKGGAFSSTNPGTPIYFSLSHLDDHSVVKTRFRINIDTPPVYARLEYENVISRNEDYINGDPQSNNGDRGTGHRSYRTADVYMRFYSDMLCTVRTFPPVNIGFTYNFDYSRVDHSDDGGYSYPSVRDYEDKGNKNFIKNNVFRSSEILIKSRATIYNYDTYNGIQDFSAGGQFPYTSEVNETSNYTLIGGPSYKVVAPR